MRTLLRHVSARTEQDRGAIIPLVALTLPVIILMTAFAVDLGQQRDARRTAQARADMVSLDLVRSIDDRTACDLLVPLPGGGAANVADIALELQASADRNEFDVSRVAGLVWGHVEPDPSGLTVFVPHHDPGAYPADCSALPQPTSVRILTDDSVDYSFQPGTGEVNRDAVANSVDEERAAFMLGSTLVNVTPSTNRVIGRMLSSIIPGADLVGYNGLANTQVRLRDLALALGLGSPEELLDADVTYEELLTATATALDANGDAAGAQVVSELIGLGMSAEAQDAEVNMGEVLGLTTMSPGAGLDGWVSVPQLLAAAVTVADGNHGITIPDTVLNVAGLGSVTLDLRGIEPAIRIGDRDGAEGRTAQVELGVSIDLGVSGDRNQRLCDLPSNERTLLGALLGGVFQFLNCILAPFTTALLEVDVAGTIDFQLTMAEVWARQAIDCPTERLTIQYAAAPVVADLSTALTASVRLGGSPLELLGIVAPGTGASTSGAAGSINFDVLDEGPIHSDFEWVENPAYYEDHGVARVGAPTVGLRDLLQLGGFQITVANANLPVTGGIARNLVEPVINGILTTVDAVVVAEVSRLLGLNLGGADISPQSMHCDRGLRLVG